ncbi:hypothetical protein L1049_023690 [Liquidambar formosana]|uniref:PGG domain-containing protein n=1 Tax=Liquidambar formosana TaxID=63359 RepID=A0AAP0X0R8_LIQFO
MAKEQDIQRPVQQNDPIEEEESWRRIRGTKRGCAATWNTKIEVERQIRSVDSAIPTNQKDIESGEHETDKYMDLELYRAATRNDFISVLKPASMEIDSVSPLGNSVLHVAASSGNEKNVRDIAYEFPSLVTKQNSKGDTALHIAARAGHALVVEALVGLQRDRLLRLMNNEGNTALHEALINCPKSVAIDHLIQADSEVIYYPNKEEKSPLYLAAEAGYVDCLKKMLENEAVNGNIYERLRGKSPVHAALMGKKKGVLDMILEKEPRFIHLRDEKGGTLHHLAAYMGYLEVVRYLLERHNLGAIERDKKGSFPVHLASSEGHVDVIKKLLEYFPYPWELLNNNHQNILHVAAESGKHDVVSYILKTRRFEKMINEKDKDGNTPLHLATMNFHPNIVLDLTWDKRVEKKFGVINNEGLTALDAALYKMEETPSFQQQLTWAALKSAGASQGPASKVSNGKGKNPQAKMDDYVNTLLLVSTLIATVTFAAGFTMPGRYNDSDPDQGMAIMLKRRLFHRFVFCDTIAMYSSIVVVLTLIWGQLRDLKLLHTAHRIALPFLGIALTSMSLAFMAGVCLVVGKLSWLFTTILIMSLVFVVAFLLLLFLLWSPVESPHCILRYITYYPFRLLIYVGQCK